MRKFLFSLHLPLKILILHKWNTRILSWQLGETFLTLKRCQNIFRKFLLFADVGKVYVPKLVITDSWMAVSTPIIHLSPRKRLARQFGPPRELSGRDRDKGGFTRFRH
ncbi:hypothetical protein CEXT_603611 [Caerostris extrusa]|uniref:Uncharacterized protein n=1 Tax=Caerostris extrusa TaxID=172846 RepID=A0AAV4PU54_CAEEX|nr:hypothetical protein CEXT_603611 [Caerostris extrusa]